MMSFSYYDEVCKVVTRQLGLDDVTLSSRLVEDLGAESADFVTIVSRLEERFDLVLEEETIAEISTVGELVEAFESSSRGRNRNVDR